MLALAVKFIINRLCFSFAVVQKTFHFYNYFDLYILEFPKIVLLQTVKTQMKCSIMLHFMSVCTVLLRVKY